MAWVTPRTWDNETVTAAKLNQELQANQIAIKAPPTDSYTADEVSNYTTISNNYGNVDGTNYSFSLTTTGGDVLIGFNGGANAAYLDVLVDGTLIVNDTNAGLVDATFYGSGCCFVHIVTGLAAGVHTFVLQFKTPGVGTGTILAGAGTSGLDIHSVFYAREIS
jgi:hypothetical protein